MYFDSCENETEASDEKKEREDNKDKIHIHGKNCD